MFGSIFSTLLSSLHSKNDNRNMKYWSLPPLFPLCSLLTLHFFVLLTISGFLTADRKLTDPDFRRLSRRQTEKFIEIKINMIILPLRYIMSDIIFHQAAQAWFPWCFNDPAPYRSWAETEPTAKSLIDHGATSQQPAELTYSFQLAFSRKETDGGREGNDQEGKWWRKQRWRRERTWIWDSSLISNISLKLHLIRR